MKTFSTFFQEFYDSEEVTSLLTIISFAVAGSAVHKVLMWGINGSGYMVKLAIFQLIRAAIFILSILYVCYEKSISVTWILAIAECGFAGLIFVSMLVSGKVSFPRLDLTKKLTAFAYKTVFNGMGNEINYKVDLLVIGFFLSDELAGIYGFIGTFLYGFIASFNVIKNFINPHISRAKEDIGAIKDYRNKIKIKLFFCGGAVFLASMVAFLGIAWFVLPKFYQAQNILIFGILLSAPLILSSLVPFDGLLIYSGKPLQHSKFLFMMILVNLLLNLVFVPLWGVLGAAIATSLSMLVGYIYFNYLVKKNLGISLL